MSNATWTRTGLAFGGGEHTRGRRKTSSISRQAALSALGSVVYAARLANGSIKIGWTENFEDRLRYLSAYTKQDVELLAFTFGTFADEQAIHAELIAHRATIADHPDAREYYNPTLEVLAVVNAMRTSLNMPHLRGITTDDPR